MKIKSKSRRLIRETAPRNNSVKSANEVIKCRYVYWLSFSNSDTAANGMVSLLAPGILYSSLSVVLAAFVADVAIAKVYMHRHMLKSKS